MSQDPLQVLHAASRQPVAAAPRQRLVIAGATGLLGEEVLRRLLGSGAWGVVQVLAREPVTAGLRGVQVTLVPSEAPQDWPPAAVDVGVVLFEPARAFSERERALWTPAPGQLLEVARWLRASGAQTLAVVMPHAPGRLPDAIKRGLANLDEHAVAALGFERLLILRSARKPADPALAHPAQRLARWMLSFSSYMVPSSEQPVRAVHVAELLDAALRLAPPGIHVAAPEVVWQSAQRGAQEAVQAWLG